MTDYATSGDAIMASLKMLSELMKADKPASEALRKFKALPQRIINIKADDRAKMIAVLDAQPVQNLIAEAEESLKGTGRVVIRPSGTEPIIARYGRS